jgi:pimeloyl-ACP methyl ester carboxylesterase
LSGIYKSATGGEAVRERYAEILRDWPVPNEQLRIATRHGETFMVASGPGDGPALILLHGSAINSAMWMGDVTRWAEHFRVFAVDLPGEPGFSDSARLPLASGAYGEWLADVMAGLGLQRASFVGISLGGWMAVDFATRNPDKVEKLVLLSPGGIGRHRNVLLWALPLLLLGGWGRKRLLRIISGPAAAGESEEAREFARFTALIFKHFRPRTERLPPFDDQALARLAMPVLAILGGRDVFIDSPGTRERLGRILPRSTVHYVPEAGHFLPGQTDLILGFLLARPAAADRPVRMAASGSFR